MRHDCALLEHYDEGVHRRGVVQHRQLRDLKLSEHSNRISANQSTAKSSHIFKLWSCITIYSRSGKRISLIDELKAFLKAIRSGRWSRVVFTQRSSTSSTHANDIDMEAWLQHRRLKRDVLRQHNTGDDSSSNQILRATPPEKSEDHVVSFDDDDPHDPRRWTWKWRLFYLMIVWWLVFVTGWASSADSTG